MCVCMCVIDCSTGLPWKADIVLNDTRGSDAGVYHCVVNNPPETGDQGIEELVLDVLGEPLHTDPSTCSSYQPLTSHHVGPTAHLW